MTKAIQKVLFIIVVLSLTIVMPLSARDRDADREKHEFDAKMSVYRQAQKDLYLQALIEQVNQNPGDQRLIDQMLMRMSLSPLDMFRMRMEANHHEYIVPRQTMDLHHRWLNLHPEINVFRPEARSVIASSFFADSSLIILAATVSTNRNAAATYTPAPNAYDGEIQLAVNKNNTNQMVAGANTWNSSCDTQSIVSSIDGGATWRYACAPLTGTFGSQTLSCQAGESVLGSDPAVYWDNSNNVYFNYMLMCCNSACQAGTANPRSSMVVAKSVDSGLNWTRQGTVVNNLAVGNTNFDDKQFYNVDNNPSSPYYGRHYTCWDQNNNNKFAYSTNSGASFTIVDLPSPGGANMELGCELAVQKNGTVHEIFNELTCGATCTGEATYYTRSTNGGASWSTPLLIKSHLVYSNFGGSANKIQAANSRGINPFGSIDVDNSGGAYDGRLYVVYSDMASGSDMNLSDTYVAFSTDNGATWSSSNMKKVNDDATSTAQFQATLVVDQSNGHVVTAWYDGRNDTTNKRKIDLYASRSTDGGATWEANTKVTAASSEFTANTGISYSDENSTDNSGANPNNYGEYLGVDAQGGSAFVAWTDSRPYFPNTNTAGTAQKENFGYATVTFTTSSDTTAPTTSLTAPSAGATLTGTATVSASASDNVGVTNVEFYRGTTLIGSDSTSPYSISWDTTGTTNGTYTLTSKAYDAAGNNASSAGVSVTVNNTTPSGIVNGDFETGSLSGWTPAGTAAVNTTAKRSGTYGDFNGSTAPTNGDSNIVQTFTVPAGGGTVSFWYKMTCPDTVTYDWVTATLRDNTTATTTTLLAKTCATNASFVQVTSGALTAGHSVTLTLTSHDDNYAGDASYTYFDDVVFTPTTTDTTAPTTSITAPANGATVANTITVSANASDNVGVTNVEFYRGTTLLGSDATSPYSISWNTTSVTNGSYSLTSKAYDAAGNNATSTAVSVTVNNTTAPPDLTATYNSTYKAPTCAAGGKSCDSGASLLNGRGTMSNGIEPNQPNTINGSCADGSSGSYHGDESLDRIKIATNDGSAFAASKAVTITFTTWCYDSTDRLDVYYTSNAATPSWTLIGTQNCTAAGAKTFTATYTLPSGANQAVRGNFRYGGTASSCTSGSYNDHDDLVFGVN